MQATAAANSSQTALLAGKYLTFQLGREVFGVEILKVREIIGLMDITPVPRSPVHVRGVINLRGKIIPVVDLRTSFAMDRVKDTEQTCIIVVDLSGADSTIQMGVLVDSVAEVLDIKQEQIEPAPKLGAGVQSHFIRGLAKHNGQVKILIDMSVVVAEDGLAAIQQAVGAATAAPAAAN